VAKYEPHKIATGDASDLDFHLRRVRAKYPKTISPAALRRLIAIGEGNEEDNGPAEQTP
jgi:hypothetical protein